MVNRQHFNGAGKYLIHAAMCSMQFIIRKMRGQERTIRVFEVSHATRYWPKPKC